MKTIAALLTVLCAAIAASTVTEQQLLDAQADAATWLTYGKNYQGWRFSPLAEINTATVSRLAARWIYQTGASGNHETTPLVFGGMMYVTGPSNHADALDRLQEGLHGNGCAASSQEQSARGHRRRGVRYARFH
jgi:glucose dehydrogenase